MTADPLPSGPAAIRPRPPHPKYLSRPRSEDPKDLGFTRRPMVDWLAPAQLARTGLKSVMSGIFGAYADKREVMAALNPASDPHDYSHQAEIWIDYIADLGDGFDATYSMASLLAAERLEVGGRETRRGEILVLGGDQVYPTASFEEYRDRMMMPYRAALPCVLEGEPPHLYAIPGNHDWYDGLSNFSRLFCQGGWMGGWKSQQHRSYFTLKLPHNWWLWGIDIQLEGFIDDPQIQYFLEQARRLRPGDRVILCTAEPSWVYAVTKGEEAFRSLSYFEDRVIREVGKARPTVTLTGDLHHYTRYESADGETQRITAGGGGAYLYATHQMPETLRIKEGREQKGDQVVDRTVDYSLKQTFPSRERSLGLAFQCFRLPWRSWRFGIFLAMIYSLYGWIVQSASRSRPGQDSFLANAAGTGNFKDVLRDFANVVAHSPSSLIFTLLILLGCVGFCAAKGKAAQWALGLLHGAAHILLALLLMWGFVHLNVNLFGNSVVTGAPHVLAFLAEMLVVGGFLGGVLMAAYLMLCSFLGGFHTNEVFSSQRIADYKNFLRLHIDPAGKLTIYPVGVAEVRKGKDWQLRPQGALSDPWWTPREPIRPELIEEPITIA